MVQSGAGPVLSPMVGWLTQAQTTLLDMRMSYVCCGQVPELMVQVPETGPVFSAVGPMVA